MTKTRLRQVVLVAHELEPVADAIEAALGVRDGFNDPGVGAFGLKNVVYSVGSSFLEVVVPVEEKTAAGRTMDKHGEGGYMAIFQVTDIEAVRQRVKEMDIRVVWHAELDDIQAMHLHPKDIGAAIVSIDEPLPFESWRWGGPTWIGDNVPATTGGVTGMTVRVPDPDVVAARWAAVLGEELSDGTTIVLDDGRQTVRFVGQGPGEREGISAFSFKVPDAQARTAEIGGATFEIA